MFSEFRLVGGDSENSGRVEVAFGGVWGTVCDDNFNQMAADMVCRSMGYKYVIAFSRYFIKCWYAIFFSKQLSKSMVNCDYITNTNAADGLVMHKAKTSAAVAL